MTRSVCVGVVLLLAACGGRTLLTGVAGEGSSGGGESSGGASSGGESSGGASSGGESSGTEPSSCETLSDCCASLPTEATVFECRNVVATGDDLTCSESLEEIQAQGFCESGTGGASSASVGGESSGFESSGGESSGFESSGGESSGFESSGGESSGGESSGGESSGSTPCAELLDCCPTLPANDMQACQAQVNAGSESECSQVLSAIQESGFCETNGGSGSGTGGG